MHIFIVHTIYMCKCVHSVRIDIFVHTKQDVYHNDQISILVSQYVCANKYTNILYTLRERLCASACNACNACNAACNAEAK